jgi:hypothetical protein
MPQKVTHLIRDGKKEAEMNKPTTSPFNKKPAASEGIHQHLCIGHRYDCKCHAQTFALRIGTHNTAETEQDSSRSICHHQFPRAAHPVT